MANTTQISPRPVLKSKRRTTQSFKYLPRDWRKQVVQRLKNEGIIVHPQIITNLRNGRTMNNELLEKVTNYMSEINEIRKQEVQKRKRLLGL
jgi:hypothetical protein